jgi:hypothetical protein
LKNKIAYPSFEQKNLLYKYIVDDNELHEIFKNDIYYKGTVLEKMEVLRKMKSDSKEYHALYNEIIQVGEYPV